MGGKQRPNGAWMLQNWDMGRRGCMTGLPKDPAWQPARNSLRINDTVIQPRRSSGSTVCSGWATTMQVCKCQHVFITGDLYKESFHREWKQSERSKLSSDTTDLLSLALACPGRLGRVARASGWVDNRAGRLEIYSCGALAAWHNLYARYISTPTETARVDGGRDRRVEYVTQGPSYVRLHGFVLWSA